MSGFTFTGGALCLDFCNTADGDITQAYDESLNQYEDLLAWAQAAGTLDEATTALLRETAADDPEAAATALGFARALRMTLYRLFAAIAAGAPPPPDELEAFNAAFAYIGKRQVIDGGDGLRAAWVEPDNLYSPLWPVEQSAYELLTAGRLDRLRECAGDGCTWLFIDASRNHSRRWCDMRDCGNRAKVKAHYQRKKAMGAHE